VRGGDVQDECRHRRVHRVRKRQVFWGGGGYRGERMLDVPGQLRRAGGEYICRELYLQCRLHWSGWWHMHCVRAGDVQDECRHRRVHRVRIREILWGGGGYRGERMLGVPGQLRRAGGERGGVGV
jgi:hypothetical protein